MQLLDGKLVSNRLISGLAAETAAWVAAGGAQPHLAAILVGSNPASEVYVASKIRSCKEVGFRSSLVRFGGDVTESVLLSEIIRLNGDPNVHGILVQLPLPRQISSEKVTLSITPEKDVDGFHPINLGRMVSSLPCFLPATPLGILRLLEAYTIETTGKHAVVLGRSTTVGTPVSLLMSRPERRGNCTVTLCHSKTQDLASFSKSADILIAAIGVPEFVRGDMIKPGAVVVDVGMNRINDSSRKSGTRLTGDVLFEEAAEKCSYLTPVPGGVGLMTIASLLENTLKAARHDVYPE